MQKKYCRTRGQLVNNSINPQADFALPDAIQLIERYIEKRDLDFTKKNSDFILNGPYMLRGIAGSGKTIQLCQRAVIAHKYHPEWKIALVFFTQSLYGYVNDLVAQYCKILGLNWTNGGNLQVMHAWGNRERTGLYREIASNNGISPLGVDDAPGIIGPNNKLAFLCKSLLEQTQITPLYDMILIDEGQDLVVDDPNLLYQMRQPIYWMGYQALRPINDSRPETRRLIWAFDEYQNINSRKVPTSLELFGSDPTHRRLMQGRSEIMRVCYRTPQPILLAAHALGMGLYNPGGMLSGPTNAEDWEALGYDVTGTFRVGNEIQLSRKMQNSPNPVFSHWQGPLIEIKTGFIDVDHENMALVKEISYQIEENGVRPDDILVVSMYKNNKCLNDIWNALTDSEISSYVVGTEDSESLSGKRPDKFREPGSVTISRLFRAKGNESNIVYIVHLDQVAQNPDDLNSRNSLFTAMTRSRGWLKISGQNDYPFYEEVRKVIHDVEVKERISFLYKGPPKLKLDIIRDERLDKGWQMNIDGY